MDPIGDGMFGAKDDRREMEGLGVPGISPRSDELDDLRTRAGEEERCRLMTLELLRTAL